jgi:hypothetical protein
VLRPHAAAGLEGLERADDEEVDGRPIEMNVITALMNCP